MAIEQAAPEVHRRTVLRVLALLPTLPLVLSVPGSERQSNGIGRTLAMTWERRPDLTPAEVRRRGVVMPEDRDAVPGLPDSWQTVGVLAVLAADLAPYRRHAFAFVDPGDSVHLGTAPEGHRFRPLPGDASRVGIRVRIGDQPLRGIIVGLREPYDEYGELTPDPIQTREVARTTVDDAKWHGAVLLT